MKQACCSYVDVAERTSSSPPPVVVMLVMVAARSADGRCQHFHVSLSSELTERLDLSVVSEIGPSVLLLLTATSRVNYSIVRV